ncbi:hypothetical protein C1645_812216 [Glomus cerebriforme]|uniref:Uncharacterized protein n=1 Tax=Glomus cerebriforme TaxID=658196 RepID=A0A397TKW0_9GLOM|nr:hypothetical protein C1645_812216 [Glomus cerebriforme]
MIGHLKKGDWDLVKNNLSCHSCLKGIGMSLDDIKLLRKMKDKSNIKFHCNDQSLEEATMLLNSLIPDEMNQYKPSLQKALKAIDKWRSSKF